MRLNLRLPCSLLPYQVSIGGRSLSAIADHPIPAYEIVPVCVEDIKAVVKRWGGEPTTYTVILSNGVQNAIIADDCPPEIIEYLENHASLRITTVPST